MNGRKRALRNRAAALFLTLITLCGQSVLPVMADTADTDEDAAANDYIIEQESVSESLDNFDRIAVSSLHGDLIIRSGEDYGISFAGWDETPQHYVQDGILVITGKKTDDGTSDDDEAGGAGSGGAKSDDEQVVVIGEDEPGDAGGREGGGNGSGTTEPEEGENAGPADTAKSSDEAADADGNGTGTEPAEDADHPEDAADTETEDGTAQSHENDDGKAGQQTMITIPSGVGLETLRVAIMDGTLIITDITASDVTIQSTGGDVILRDVSLGTVDIYASEGDVSLIGGSFNNLSIGVGKGNVTVRSDEGLARCRMELHTGNGTVTVNGASKGNQYLQPGNGKRILNIQDEEGDINVTG